MRPGILVHDREMRMKAFNMSSTVRSATPARASIAVIGAGIVGNCLVAHLAELGWRDLLLIDKGPLPKPGGSTGHASNFIFPTDHNREIAMLTLDSQRQYEALGVNTTCGGIEGGAHRGPHGGIAPAHDLGPGLGASRPSCCRRPRSSPRPRS